MKAILVVLTAFTISYSLSAQSLGSWGKYSLTGSGIKKTAIFDYVVNPILIEKESSNLYMVGDSRKTVRVKFEMRDGKIYVGSVINGEYDFFNKTKTEHLEKEGIKPKFKKNDFKSVLVVYHGLFKKGITNWKSKGLWNDKMTKKNGYGMKFQGPLIAIGRFRDYKLTGKVYLFSNEGMAGEFDYTKGKRNGMSVQNLEAGTIVTGKYVNNLKEGPFTFKYTNGESEIIHYQHNERIKKVTTYSSKPKPKKKNHYVKSDKTKTNYAKGKSEIIDYQHKSRVKTATTHNSKPKAKKKKTNYYGMSDTAITNFTNFSSDIDNIKKYYKKKDLLVAGPFSGTHAEDGYDHPLVGAYCASFQLKSNRLYDVMVVVDKKKNPCKELKVKVKYGNTSITEPPPKTLLPKESDDKSGNWINQKHHIYWTAFESGPDFKNVKIRAYSKCNWTKNARIFILKRK